MRQYTDTSGKHHLIVSTGDKAGNVVEYVTLESCPYCGRKFTENMECECGSVRLHKSCERANSGNVCTNDFPNKHQKRGGIQKMFAQKIKCKQCKTGKFRKYLHNQKNVI